MASTKIVLRKDKIKRNGEGPLYVQVIKNRRATKISTGLYIKPVHWDGDKEEVKRIHPNSKRYNIRLMKKKAEIVDTLLAEEDKNINVSTKKLKRILRGEDIIDFFVFANKVTEEYMIKGSIGTYDKNVSILKKLKEYMKKSSLSFSEFDFDFLKRYERYLKTELKNKPSTIGKDFKYIRKICNDAISAGILRYEDSPFQKYKIQVQKTQKEYLDEKEIQDLTKLRLKRGSVIGLHRDMFVFNCSCGGIRIKDLLLLQWKNFNETHLNVSVSKTTDKVAIKVPQFGLKILTKYKTKKIKPSQFIFPALPEKLKLDDPRKIDLAISRGTALFNKNLKILAGRAKIEKNLSSHIARHTFATRALRKGINVEVVSKIMAHSNIKQTLEYAKIVMQEMDEAMDKFNS